MKEFNCGDVVPGCNVCFRARDEQEILTEVARHAQADHGLTEIPQSLVDMVRTKIRVAAA